MTHVRRQSGFTIIELLVVVAIIALLVAILLPAIGKAREEGMQTQFRVNRRKIAVACGTYGADFADRQWTDQVPHPAPDATPAHVPGNARSKSSAGR